ncbi:MAG: hypothetical protein QXZ25_00990 [Candidatus Bathyarchaeia archaeon]
MDEYRKGWALRYIREAKAELEAARKMPYMAPSLVLEAIRKARNAIHYSLGEPAFIEAIIRESAAETRMISDSFLRFLLEIEQMIQQLAQLEGVDGEKAMEQADKLINVASEIVETLTEEKIED